MTSRALDRLSLEELAVVHRELERDVARFKREREGGRPPLSRAAREYVIAFDRLMAEIERFPGD